MTAMAKESDSVLQIGFIGAGWIAERHLDALEQIEDVKVTAIFNPTRSKAETLAARCGAKVCDSPREVIRSVDVVYALAPPDVRVAHVMEAARHGKDVFCEKPFALTLSEANRQIEVIEQASIKVYVGFVMRHFANFRLLHDTFTSGELGDLVTVWTRRLWYRNVPKGHYQNSMARSGGLTFELNVHDFDWMRTIGGEVHSVYGRTVGTRPDRDVEENSWCVLNFEQGFGVVGTSWLSAIKNTSAGIIGTRGTMILEGKAVIQKTIDSDNEKTFTFEEDRGMPGALLAQAREFIRCIREDGEPAATMYDGRAATAIALAVIESARRNEVVPLPER